MHIKVPHHCNTNPVTNVSGQLFLPTSVTGEVYCFPRRLLVFSFGRRVIYRSKGLSENIPMSIPSVYTTAFKQIAGLSFYPKFSMLHLVGFV